MKHTLKNIGNLLFVILLMVSTTGFTIFKIHCSCLQLAHYSVFLEPESCHQDEALHCCSAGHETTHAEDCSNCDTHESSFVKLDTEFISSSVGEPIILPVIVLAEGFSVIDDRLLSSGELFISYQVNSPPIIVPSGKKIVTLHHQFKFDQQSLFV